MLPINVCPNCGAVLRRHVFMLLCDYCSYSSFQDVSVLHIPLKFADNAKTRYEKLSISEVDINKSRFVNLEFVNKTIIVSCKKSFFGNDFHYCKINTLSMEYVYSNDGSNEELLMAIKNDSNIYTQPQFAMRINRKLCIVPNFCNKLDGKYLFNLSIDELYVICTAKTIDVATNLTDTENVNYNELRFYSSRFYNLIFDKRKFLYSLNINLITD